MRPGSSEESRGQEGQSWRRDWGITEHGELGPPRAQGGLRGLALVGGVVRQLGVADLQVVLPGVRGAHDPVPWPGCRDTKGKRGEPRPSLGTGLDRPTPRVPSLPTFQPHAWWRGLHQAQATSPPSALALDPVAVQM